MSGGVLAAVTFVAFGVFYAAAGPAQAAPPCDADSFIADFNGAADGSTVTLCGNMTIREPATPLAVSSGRSVTLDLDGRSLAVTGVQYQAGIRVPDGAALTVEDTSAGQQGHLSATGGFRGAGIGASDDSDCGAVTINGGTVVATGGDYGAGIGGGDDSDGSTDTGAITINGGTVTATGGDSGAGIGGGYAAGGTSNGGAVTISGGTVTATGGDYGVGIGGGYAIGGISSGGTVTISAGTVTATGGFHGVGIGGGYADGDGAAVAIGQKAAVTVSGGDGMSAIGAGDGTSFGSLSNAGTMLIPSGNSITIPSGVTVPNSGTIKGDGALNGAGKVTNSGVIWHTVTVDTSTGLSVTDHNYELAFDPNGGQTHWGSLTPYTSVYGPTLSSVGRTTADLPGATRSDYTLTGWYLDPATTGSPVGDSTTLSSTSSAGAPVGVDLHAGWAESNPPSITTTSLPDGEVGVDYDATLQASGGVGSATWTVTAGALPDGLSLEKDTGKIAGTPQGGAVGTASFTVQVSDDNGVTDTQQLSIDIAAGQAATVTVTAGDGQAAAAGTDFGTGLSVAVSDGHGNPVAAGTDVTFTVTSGSASFGAKASATVPTGSDGTARAPTLTAGDTAGPVTVTATVAGVDASASFTETVYSPLAIDTQTLADGTVGQPYTAALNASGGADTDYVWSLASGALPSGLHLDSDGTISGIPTKAGTYRFTVSVNDPVTANLTLTVNPASSAAAPSTPSSPTTVSPVQPSSTTPALAETGFDVWGALRDGLLVLVAGSVLILAAAGIRRRRL